MTFSLVLNYPQTKLERNIGQHADIKISWDFSDLEPAIYRQKPAMKVKMLNEQEAP
jgi:hypothetical protein